jgi:hypothetical protein
MNERTQFLGRAGHVAGWEFLIAPGDDILATNGDRVIRHTPKNYGTSLLELMSRPTAAVGWARMPDDMEILFFYDKGDDNFGYALNLDVDYFSEWGYAPF